MNALTPIFARWSAGIPAARRRRSAITDVRFGADTAVLTDRRVVVTGRNFEQSLPLAHISLVRVRFERIAGDLVFAAVAVLAALVLFAVAPPMRAFLAGQAASLEPAAQAERDGGEGHEPPRGCSASSARRRPSPDCSRCSGGCSCSPRRRRSRSASRPHRRDARRERRRDRLREARSRPGAPRLHRRRRRQLPGTGRPPA